MKKPTRKYQKLVLSRESIRQLNLGDLRQAGGGFISITTAITPGVTNGDSKCPSTCTSSGPEA